ncbi:MAG: hypothetical protein IJW42_07030 [Alistipes sp.]|nr:hypothetical protein [Alistipes sp.]
MRKSILLVVCAMIAGITTASAQGTLPRKVENPTICDMEGNQTKLPHWGEKNLLIFYVDPDSYIGKNANKDFSSEIEENKRASGPNIYGFGIINTADTKLPKGLVRNMARKRCEKNGALSLDDQDHSLVNGWGLGSCDGKFAILVISKDGELVYAQKEELTPEGKKAFYDFIEAYK